MKVIVGCLVEDNGRYLMVQEGSKKRYGLWNYPTGHLEVNETMIEGAIRETFEESGYQVEVVGVLPIQEIYQNDDKYILVRFVGKVISFDEDHKLDGILQAKWMSKEEIFNIEEKNFRGYGANRDILEYYLNGKIYPIEMINNICN